MRRDLLKEAAPADTFLGEEFLTWLWFRFETEGGQFSLADGTRIGVAIDDFLCLADADPTETEQTLRRGLPTRSAEATAGLMAGKRVRRARLILAEAESEWSVVLDAELKFRSARCTASSETDDQDVSQARIASFLRLAEIVDELYRQFLDERLSGRFGEETAPRMRKWIGARS